MTTTHAPTVPPHVPPDLVRRFEIDFRGPLDELFPRLDALRSDARALWLEIGLSAWPETEAQRIVLDVVAAGSVAPWRPVRPASRPHRAAVG